MNHYTLELENDRLLNITPFIEFCIANQEKDIVVQVNNEGHCLQHCGVYKILDLFRFKSVELRTWNIIETHPKYFINTNNWNWWLKNFRKFDLSYDYTWTQNKIFGCFYGRPSAPRLGIATHLLSKHKQKSLIKIKFDFDNEDTRKLFDIQRLFSWHPEAIDIINQLKNNDYASEKYVKGQWEVNNPLSYLYKEILIDIVSEPTCEGSTFYPTEKIVRAILCRRPFIAMCSKNYLIYLRQMGFKTFHDFWNEDYDGYEGKEKYHMILQLIDTISCMSESDLQKIYNGMHDILEHNFNLIVSQSYTKKIQYVE